MMSLPGDPQADESVTGIQRPLVPVSAEDFARRKRRLVFIWMGAGMLVLLLAIWTYRRSVDPLEAQKSLEEGKRFLKATRYPEAVLSFSHALALRSDLVDGYLLRGRANAGLGRLDLAVQDFSKVIQLSPQGAEAFVERAAARLDQEDYPGVIADSGEALKRDSRIALAYNLRGRAFRKTGSPERALEDLSRAVELAPDQSNYFQRAATYQLLGQHKLALADLDAVIALKPDGPQAYFARAQSRRATGDVAGANQDHRQALLLDGR
jgi:tetratricopeptide (TPR) repeat protein